MSDIYEQVRGRLDMFPRGFPKIASGVELEILRHLFNPEEGEVMLALRTRNGMLVPKQLVLEEYYKNLGGGEGA